MSTFVYGSKSEPENSSVKIKQGDRAFCYIIAPFTDVTAAEKAYATVCAVRMIAEAALGTDEFNNIKEAFAYCRRPDEEPNYYSQQDEEPNYYSQQDEEHNYSQQDKNRNNIIKKIWGSIPEFKPINKYYYPNIPELATAEKVDDTIIFTKYSPEDLNSLYTAAISAADFAVYKYLFGDGDCEVNDNRRVYVFVVGNYGGLRTSFSNVIKRFKCSFDSKGNYEGRGMLAVLLNDDKGHPAEPPERFNIKNDEDIRKLKELLE